MKFYSFLFVVFIGLICVQITDTSSVASTSKKEIQGAALISSCVFKNSKHIVNVSKLGDKVYVSISTETKKSIVNDSIIVQPNSRCPAEGFEYLSCREHSFIIIQQLCDSWMFIKEVFVFKNSDSAPDDFFLYLYKQETVDRRHPEKDPVVDKYTQDHFGKVNFQNVSRDFIGNLINR